MLQTLFYIHDHVFGIPLFGPTGVVFVIWAVVALAVLGRLSYRLYGLLGLGRQKKQSRAKATELNEFRIARKRATLDLASTMAVMALVGAALSLYIPSLFTPIPGSQDLGLPIRGYGVMVLLGVVSGVWLAVCRAKKRGFDVELIFNLALWLFLGGIIGARLFYVVEYWGTQFFHLNENGGFDFIATLKAVLNIAQGGLVIYGALIGGGVAGLLFWLRHRDLPMLRIADVIAPSMALGLGIGRIGCFLNGCCFGGVSDVPWAVQFPEQSPPYMRQVETGQLYLHGLSFRGTPTKAVVEISGVEPGSEAEKAGLQPEEQIIEIRTQGAGEAKARTVFSAEEQSDAAAALAAPRDRTLGAAERALLGIKGEGTRIMIVTSEKEYAWTIARPDDVPPRSLPVHPTQLYSAIDAVLLCLLLLAFDPFRKRDGEVLALMLTVHPISRFLLESIRTDEPKTYQLPIVSSLLQRFSGTDMSMSISQLLSVAIFVVAVGLWAYLILRKPRLDGSDLVTDEVEPDEPAVVG
jgi:phosphatidylglycerol---prolipoprotein diacylglyceryl transferase